MKTFPAIRIEGGLFAPDLLDQLLTEDLPGQRPRDFGLDGRRSLTDEIAAVFSDAQALWQVFQHRLETLPESDSATSATRDVWMIPFLSLLGYELQYNRKAYTVGGLTFAISHRAGQSEDAPPVHIVGARQDLGRLAPTGRPRLAPHSLVQEFLNRTEALWGIVTNGTVLRLLRDSTYIRRQSYVEFDLQAIFEQHLFQDFAALYRLLHRSRLPRPGDRADSCLLEQYYHHSVEQGGRVRDRLRDGVEECIKILANGFLKHPANSELRQRIEQQEMRGEGVMTSGQEDRAGSEWRTANGKEKTTDASASHHASLTAHQLYHQLLRLVYRFLFLFVSEDRGLISQSQLYLEHYSVSRLRRLVDMHSAYTEYDDLWLSLRVLWKLLSDDTPVPQIGGKPLAALLDLPVLNGELFEPIGLDECRINNRDLLGALWFLVNYQDSPTSPARRVNYAALDVEELGSIYESLLEYHPQIDFSGTFPRFDLVFGSERKSTGSYYTPTELVAELIKSALEPVIEERLKWARQVASGEWQVVKTDLLKTLGEQHVYRIISRLGSLAGRDGAGGGDLSTHPNLSQSRTIRTDQSNAASSHFDPGKHCRGMGASQHQGISAISEDISRQPARTGNVSDFESADQSGTRRQHKTLTPKSHHSESQASQSTTESEAQIADIWERLPLATRYSLLAEKALLSIRVIDPAAGSGHFLLAAARRLGKELARIRTGEDEPAPERVREAIRDVVAHCIYGVDRNPLAVELCKVALWIEAHTPGKPLTFLDHRIKCGDSLIGVFDLSVLQKGIPDEAFKPVSGDDKKLLTILKKQNRQEREGQRSLFADFDIAVEVQNLSAEAQSLDGIPDDSPEAIKKKKRIFRQLQSHAEHERSACDLWTAAFFQKKDSDTPSASFITTETLWRYLERDASQPQALAHARALAQEHRFFHWPLEFPEVFAGGGFNVVLGNPPWEQIQLEEKEFFSTRDAEIAHAPNAAARKRLIRKLPETNPQLWEAYCQALHGAESASRFLRYSNNYPFTGRGRINTYSVFAERMHRLLAPNGRAGIIVPTGIATDDTNKYFFADLVENGGLVSLFDFENREKIFPAVDSRYKFCLLTMAGRRETSSEGRVESGEQRVVSEKPGMEEQSQKPLATHHLPFAEFAFFCTRAEHLHDKRRRFSLTAEDIARINPNTRTLPVFRTRQDAELTRAIYERVPVLVNEAKGENPWNVTFKQGLFNMSSDSHLFRTRQELEAEGYRLVGNRFVKGQAARGEKRLEDVWLPLYEAKMIWHYDHRFGTYEGVDSRSSTHLPTPDSSQHADPGFVVQPWYWVPAEAVEARLGDGKQGWLIGFRDVARSTDERTAIFSLLPKVGVGNNAPLLIPAKGKRTLQTCLITNLCTLVFDYVSRQKIAGTHMNFFFVEQLPVLVPLMYCTEYLLFAIPRILEILYTAWDLKPFADDVWKDADDNLRTGILRQWEENREATGGCSFELPEWAEAYPEITPADPAMLQSPLAAAHSPTCPFPPFKWDENRRARLQAELDAYYAKLYGLTRKQLRYILDPADLTKRELEDILDPWEEVDDPLDAKGYEERVKQSDFPGETFRVLKEKEIRKYGEYRTRRLVLEAWERQQ